MLIGSEFCATGAVQGVIMIAFGANMAFEGIGDIWNAVNGNEEQGTNLFKEITGHKADNLVDVAELGVGIWAGFEKASLELKRTLGTST